MNNTKQPVARQEGLIVQEMPDEVLVYDASTDKAHCLNHTAALVWKYCDGTNQVADITKIISRELNAPVKEEFVWLALDQLEKEALLEKEAEFSLKTLGVSRREVIKRIGLASVIALPLVTSLLNPMSARAGTSCNVNCPVFGTPQAPNCIAAGGIAPNNAPNCIAACTTTNACAQNPAAN